MTVFSPPLLRDLQGKSKKNDNPDRNGHADKVFDASPV